MALHRFDRATLPAAPWKNGGGLTHEIVCQPPGAGLDNFEWRVSIALIASDGPFSAFGGVDRVITLLDGAGVRLRSADGQVDHVLNAALQPFAFAGEAAVVAERIDGDCADFNLMTRRATCRGDVRVLCASGAVPPAAHGLLLALRGRWQARAGDGPGHTLLPQQGLWWKASATGWQLETLDDDAALLVASVHPRAP
jgi:environmental stress-induced protein Ves